MSSGAESDQLSIKPAMDRRLSDSSGDAQRPVDESSSGNANPRSNVSLDAATREQKLLVKNFFMQLQFFFNQELMRCSWSSVALW